MLLDLDLTGIAICSCLSIRGTIYFHGTSLFYIYTESMSLFPKSFLAHTPRIRGKTVRTTYRSPLQLLHIRQRSITLATDSSITIAGVTIEQPPGGSGRDDLIPPFDATSSRFVQSLPPSYVSTLRWMLQKDLVMKQDFCLLGHSAADQRLLALTYAALTSREIEYVSLTRDTSDADLKQRKEMRNPSDPLSLATSSVSSIYVPQAPVRAALHGRLLILDGIEKAERNVLPTLNNLLENRELSLDDGSMLVSSATYDQHREFQHDDVLNRMHRVHEDFTVLALGSLSDSSGLDPPLRSRFQAHVAPALPPGEMLDALASFVDADRVSMEQLHTLVQSPLVSSTREASYSVAIKAAKFLQANSFMSVSSVVRGFGIGTPMTAMDWKAAKGQSTHRTLDRTKVPSSFIPTHSTTAITELVQAGLGVGCAVALVGPKGSGKSALIHAASRALNQPYELFAVVPDMTSRDLLLRRATDDAGNTIWRMTPLARAVQNGSWVVLDGIDRLNSDTLTSLARLFETGQVDMPDGSRLTAHKGFGCIALAHPPAAGKSWINPEIATMFCWVGVDPMDAGELAIVLNGLFPDIEERELDKLVRLRDRLDAAVKSGAADTVEEQESLTLSLRKMKHICRRLQRDGRHLSKLVKDTLLTSLMPERERQVVQSCLHDCGIFEYKAGDRFEKDIEIDRKLIDSCRRTPENPILVPNPRFQENPGHARILGNILEAHAVGERALLIMGYQGVGKNKVVDFLLHRLQCEREYLQLHRDTTVQSVLSVASVEKGRVIYADSPLVRAATHGRILVIDEADKAPVDVVALLKGLIEDGELALPDGRVLRYDDDGRSNTLAVHADFRIWALANPAGYPFHGNNLAREMSDVFSCHTVPPLDSESQMQILRSYAPNIKKKKLSKIISLWQDLGEAHAKGTLVYPFGIREAVSAARHMNEFPNDGLTGAIENVIAFDRSDLALMKQLNSIFRKHGIELSSSEPMNEKQRTEGGISTPRTRVGDPKHGKVDPDNTPHIGGNTWYGGTGGSDTAGLGGRGGPYRVDLGHPVHQVSDEMKAQVSDEAQHRAREIAAIELEKKLRELSMGKYDWERYKGLRERVALQIEQLRVHLKDLQHRMEERMWLNRQFSGELDESRLVDALAGEKDVFKRRGTAVDSKVSSKLSSDKMRIKVVVDVSASMYRFNGYDGRLERLLEATLMIMEALRSDDRFRLEIVGHNGSSAVIPLLKDDSSLDEATQLRILQGMIAHTQYTYAGDSTLEAIQSAMEKARPKDLVLMISDANLERYRIEPIQVVKLLQKPEVHAHLILISSFGEEAYELANAVPNGRAQVCLDSSELPLILKKIIVASAAL